MKDILLKTTETLKIFVNEIKLSYYRLLETRFFTGAYKTMHQILCFLNVFHAWNYYNNFVSRNCIHCNRHEWRDEKGWWREVKGLVFAVWDNSVKVPSINPDGIHIYPTKEELEKACLENQSLINLPALIDPKCKKCYGTGRIGYTNEYGKQAESKHFVFCPKCLTPNLNREIRRKQAAILNTINQKRA